MMTRWIDNSWLVASLASILVGYLMLGLFRSTVIAPILLVAGYCILLPLHLWVRHRSDHEVGE